MPRYKLTIAYDGSDFCGWQKQEPPPSSTIPADKILADEGVNEPHSEIPPAPTQDSGLHDSGPPSAPRVTLRTVQEIVERAVRHVVREPVTLIGASRTDAGVHARGQVAAFSCSGDPPAIKPPLPQHSAPSTQDTPHPSPLDPQSSPRPSTGWPLSRGTHRLILALNSRLPPDILITAAEPAAPDFNPIRGAISKAYSYSLYIAPTRPLFDRNFVHYLWSPIDVAAMNAAAERFRGEHDFAAFTAAGHGRLTTTRTIFDCRVTEEKLPPLPIQLANTHPALRTQDSGPQDSGLSSPRRVTIHVAGSGFLYNMVRIIAGTLVEAGRGKLTPEDITAAINSKDRRNGGPTLPPTGLCLEWIKYAE